MRGTAIAGRAGRRRRATAFLLAMSAVGTACTETPLEEVDPASAPGQSTPTVEIEIPAEALPSWKDTTFTGYAIPATSSYRVLVDSVDFRSRILGRAINLPDSLNVSGTFRDVERFASGVFRLVIDTGDSLFADGGAEVEVFALGTSYEEREATWTYAAENEPWTSPGGDLGDLVAAAAFDSIQDTLFVPVLVNADSLLRNWRENAGEPGFAIRVSGAGTLLRVRALAVGFEAQVAGEDSLIAGFRTPGGSTVLFDPETPDPDSALRLGGLPAARIYTAFDLPDTWNDVPIRGSTINRAVLVFRSAPREPEPFALSSALVVTPLQLLADPFEVGPKTPVGPSLSSGGVLLDPETLEAAEGEFVVPITPLVTIWALADPDSVPKLRVGLIADPEGGSLQFQEFGSIDDGNAAVRPSIRVLLTPRVPFRLP